MYTCTQKKNILLDEFIGGGGIALGREVTATKLGAYQKIDQCSRPVPSRLYRMAVPAKAPIQSAGVNSFHLQSNLETAYVDLYAIRY